MLGAAPALALIDLDGTLIDSAADIHVGVNGMMQLLGGPPRGEDEVRAWVGNGVERLIHRALTGDADGEAAPTLFAHGLALFNNVYSQNNGRYSCVYDGVVAGLDFLQSRGCRLVCVTNKPHRFSEPLLAKFGLLERFDRVLGGDSLARKKPDPLPLRHAAEQLSTPLDRCLMIGDSLTDLAAARAAGVTMLAVSYGYNHGRSIAEPHPQHGAPDAVVDSLAELPGLFS